MFGDLDNLQIIVYKLHKVVLSPLGGLKKDLVLSCFKKTSINIHLECDMV